MILRNKEQLGHGRIRLCVRIRIKKMLGHQRIVSSLLNVDKKYSETCSCLRSYLVLFNTTGVCTRKNGKKEPTLLT